MATYQVVDADRLDADMTSLAETIRAKGGTTAKLAWPEGYKQAVEDISTGVELPALTNPGTAADLRQGKQLIDSDGKTVEGALAEVEVAAPTISVAANGRITAAVEQAAGITAGGRQTASINQNTIGAQTITPGPTDQSIPAYNYLTGKQTIKGDANLTPDYLYEDQALFGVQGAKSLPEAAFPQPDGLALDPDVVYKTTRPKDWLPMPTPGDDEIYLLCHMPDGLDGAFGAYIAYTGNCTISFGSLVDGVFVAKNTVTPTTNAWNYYTIPNVDYGDITAEGYRQYIVRIKGGFTDCRMQNTDDVYSYGFPGIVDAAIGASGFITFGDGASNTNAPMLAYVRFLGSARSSGGFVFRYCVNLVAVAAAESPNVSSMNYWFNGCTRLKAISPVFLLDGVSYNSAFQDCGVILPRKKFSPSEIVAMLRGTTTNNIDGRYLDTSKIKHFENFLHTNRTVSATNIDLSSATSFGDNAFNSYCLQRLTFAGETTPGGWTIGVTNKFLSHAALVEMINSLPTATAAATITITGNPGTSELTDEEIAVATAKNWTVTI